MTFDSKILALLVGMLCGTVLATWLRAAALLIRGETFRWSLFVPSSVDPVIAVAPAALFALVLLFRTDPGPGEIVAMMMASGLISYAIAVAIYHHRQLRDWGNTIRFNEHLLAERKMLVETINNSIFATNGDPQAWVEGYREFLDATERKFEEFLAQETKNRAEHGIEGP